MLDRKTVYSFGPSNNGSSYENLICSIERSKYYIDNMEDREDYLVECFDRAIELASSKVEGKSNLDGS